MFGSVGGPWKRSRRGPDFDRQVATYLIRRADAARDRHDWGAAAAFYDEALRLVPERADLHVQRGHMLKEGGNLEAAEEAYEQARILMPNDADLALQFGHLYKLAGRYGDAERAYEQALSFKPGWDAPAMELAAFRLRTDVIMEVPTRAVAERDLGGTLRTAAAELTEPVTIAKLVPALAPDTERSYSATVEEGLSLKQAGRHEPGFWGRRRTFRGVESIRGYSQSAAPIDEVQLLVDGTTVFRGPVRGPYLSAEETSGVAKYVFNIWFDFSAIALGSHAFEVRSIDAYGESQSFHDDIVVAQPFTTAELPDSDALVGMKEVDPIVLEHRIRSAPSMIRSAQRDVLNSPARSILVMRTDQLGDMIASIAAIRRLRALFPDARLVGLVTTANADIAATLALFDEIITIDFPDDPIERRRIMPLEQQEALRRKLEPYRFDIAIDLAQSSVSRELLRLSGARFLYGDQEGSFDWLTASFGIRTRDRLNQLDFVPHSRKALAMVEALGAIAHDSFEVVRRPELARDRLEPFGIGDGDRYAVLHMGARIAFSRWPGFIALAERMLIETDLKIVLMSDDAGVRAALPAELIASSRVQLIDQRLPFDDFDAFVSFAEILVGNDSGPKHLASLRGTKVVTVHSARINWNDWGQEQIGMIVSRRVPCAGCNIFHDTEECGKDFACIRDITPAEVFDAVRAQL